MELNVMKTSTFFIQRLQTLVYCCHVFLAFLTFQSFLNVRTSMAFDIRTSFKLWSPRGLSLNGGGRRRWRRRTEAHDAIRFRSVELGHVTEPTRRRYAGFDRLASALSVVGASLPRCRRCCCCYVEHRVTWVWRQRLHQLHHPSRFTADTSSASIYLDKTKHKCQGTYRHHSNIHGRAVIAVQ